MNKGDLISHLAEECEMTKVQAGEVLNTVIEAISKTLKKGDKVTLVGFGTFSVNKRPAREARNPQTGKTVKVPAKKVAKFKAGKELTDRLN